MQDYVALADLAHEGIAPVVAALLPLTGGIEVYAEIVPVGDLEPEHLARLLVPPVFPCHPASLSSHRFPRKRPSAPEDRFWVYARNNGTAATKRATTATA